MKKKHEKFLSFNGTNIIFLNKDGEYWIALKPILDALNLESDRYLKKTKRDAFFGGCLDTLSIQVENNGIIQGRKMVCLPEKFIYGWICFLNSNNEELNNYKRTCYELLYSHFHGTITGRKELLQDRAAVDKEIHSLKTELKKDNAGFKRLAELQNKRKTISTRLNSFDKDLLNQRNLFEELAN